MLIAESANELEIGWARREIYDSMAWVRASMPAEAVTGAGAVSVRFGSATATSGMTVALPMSIFTSRARSVRIVKRVTSLPVPAVVGMATSGARPGGIWSCP